MNNTTTPISVAIVEDIDEIRLGLASMIDNAEGFRCEGSFSSAERALDSLASLVPDVVLMDIQLPGMSGIDCVRQIKPLLPSLQIVMLTVYEDNQSVYDSLVAGATGYLLKNTPAINILEAIREVHAGGSPMSSQIARKVVKTFQQAGTSSRESDNLTKREQELLAMLARGHQYKEIAAKLFISIDTVRAHIRNIYEKLHVRSRTQAVLKYYGK